MNFDKYSIKEIKEMIKKNLIKEADVIKFYNNQWWDEEND
tara:strand:+ start:330 stop:449 length:120 start_codon:yes stop_codon:yes gene_type:complete